MEERQGGPLITESSGVPDAPRAVRTILSLFDLLGEVPAFDDVCRRAIPILVREFPLESASLFILDPGEKTLRLEARADRSRVHENPERPTPVSIVVGDGFIGRAAALGVVTRSGEEKEQGGGTAFPLRWRGDTLGVLVIEAQSQEVDDAGDDADHEAVNVALAQVLWIARAHHEQIRDRLFRYERLAVAGQLAASTAHEVNNILTNILLRTQRIARRDDLPEDVCEFARLVETEVERIAKLVNGLLQPARTRRGPRQAVSVNVLVQKTLDLTGPLFSKSRRIQVSSDFAPEMPPVFAEPSEIEQVFTNLILNAVQAMPRGGVLRVFTVDEGDWAVVGIADTGTGIPRDALPHLFEPFFTTRSSEGGTGLGLTVVKEIVKNHGGEIVVSTTEGAGTEFRVRLPRAHLF